MAICVTRMGCVKLMSMSAYRSPSLVSLDGEVPGGIQKFEKGGSKTPAPGHTISTEPNCCVAASNNALRSFHELTSHFWKTPFGFD